MLLPLWHKRHWTTLCCKNAIWNIKEPRVPVIMDGYAFVGFLLCTVKQVRKIQCNCHYKLIWLSVFLLCTVKHVCQMHKDFTVSSGHYEDIFTIQKKNSHPSQKKCIHWNITDNWVLCRTKGITIIYNSEFWFLQGILKLTLLKLTSHSILVRLEKIYLPNW